MSTRERIDADYIREVKAKNEAAVSTIRLLRTAIKYADIDKGKPLDEDEVIEVISKESKKLRDAVDSYREAGRQELVDKTEPEIELLKQYLPEMLDTAALEEIVRAKVSELGANTPKDIGPVMGAVMAEVKGRADGGQVSALVKSVLSATEQPNSD